MHSVANLIRKTNSKSFSFNSYANMFTFKRKETPFVNWIGKDAEFPPAANRYHLYAAYACPFSHQCMMIRSLKGLQHIIGQSTAHPTWQKTREHDNYFGWTFAKNGEHLQNPNGYGDYVVNDLEPDTVNNARFVRDLYDIANKEISEKLGKYTVPILWDKENKTIVSNESSDINQMLNGQFNQWAKNKNLNLFPDDLKSKIDEYSKWIYNFINYGVYKSGYAQSQKAHEFAFNKLFEHLDQAEEILSKNRYLLGDRLTICDLKLYATLVRFDEVYVAYFRTNKKFIHQYNHLFEYLKELYQIPEIKCTTNMNHIKMHYFSSKPQLNYYGIIPIGPNINLDAPHNRAKIGGKEKFVVD